MTRVVLTRSSTGSRVWKERLGGLGVHAEVMSLVHHAPISPAPIDLSVFDWVLFTSPRSVRRFVQEWPDARLLAARTPKSTPQCGGLSTGTRSAMEENGLVDALGADAASGAALAQALIARTRIGAVLLPGARQRLPEPRASLERAGFEVTSLALYATGPVKGLPADLPFADHVWWFCSPSSVRSFAEAWPGCDVACVAIGTTTAATAESVGLRPSVAKRPTLQGMLAVTG